MSEVPLYGAPRAPDVWGHPLAPEVTHIVLWNLAILRCHTWCWKGKMLQVLEQNLVPSVGLVDGACHTEFFNWIVLKSQLPHNIVDLLLTTVT